MLKAVTREEAELFELPGRDWYHYSGPTMTGAKHSTVGFSGFPPGSAPEGHVHPTQEETIYIVAGHGELVSPEGTVPLEPGTAVFIPIGLHHQSFSRYQVMVSASCSSSSAAGLHPREAILAQFRA